MKKLLFIAVFTCIVLALFAAPPRTYMQKVVLTDNSMPGNPADANPIPNYNLAVFISSDPGTVYTTATAANPANICLKRTGTSPNFYVVAYLNQSIFPVAWYSATDPTRYLDFTLTYTPTGETVHWTRVVPSGTGAILDTTTPIVVPPFPPSVTIPNNAGIVAPANGATNMNFAGQVLSWTAPAADATHSAADAYKVYFGTAANPPLVVPSQTGLTYNTGALTANTTYYWKVVAFNTAGDAAGTSVWSFATREEINPNVAINPTPADNATLTTVWPAANMDVVFSWEAPTTGVTPTGYLFAFNGGPGIDLGNVLTHTINSLPVGGYTWSVTPYYNDNGTKGVALVKPVAVKITISGSERGNAVNVPTWHFSIAAGTEPIDPNVIPDGGSTVTIPVGTLPGFVGPVVVTSVDPNTGLPVPVTEPVTITGTIIPVIPPEAAPFGTDFIFAMNVDVAGTYTITLPFMFRALRVWNPVTNLFGAWIYGPMGPLTNTFTWTWTGAKEVIEFVGDDDGDTLPVELSSFTGIQLANQMLVNLTWVTQSETGVIGYNVFRAEDNTYANAVRINASLIPATNTSQEQTYTLTDAEVEAGHTYYYWLQNVDMGGTSELHGPVTATVNANSTPVLPEISMLSNAYPNPFRMGQTTNINVSVKAGEKGTVTVYNILGQAVKTFNVTQGITTLKWDGKGCGSGIYFYKLSTPTTNTTKKLVVVK